MVASASPLREAADLQLMAQLAKKDKGKKKVSEMKGGEKKRKRAKGSDYESSGTSLEAKGYNLNDNAEPIDAPEMIQFEI